jgi:hypothetical protein
MDVGDQICGYERFSVDNKNSRTNKTMNRFVPDEAEEELLSENDFKPSAKVVRVTARSTTAATTTTTNVSSSTKNPIVEKGSFSFSFPTKDPHVCS